MTNCVYRTLNSYLWPSFSHWKRIHGISHTMQATCQVTTIYKETWPWHGAFLSDQKHVFQNISLYWRNFLQIRQTLFHFNPLMILPKSRLPYMAGQQSTFDKGSSMFNLLCFLSEEEHISVRNEIFYIYICKLMTASLYYNKLMILTMVSTVSGQASKIYSKSEVFLCLERTR